MASHWLLTSSDSKGEFQFCSLYILIIIIIIIIIIIGTIRLLETGAIVVEQFYSYSLSPPLYPLSLGTPVGISIFYGSRLAIRYKPSRRQTNNTQNLDVQVIEGGQRQTVCTKHIVSRPRRKRETLSLVPKEKQ